MEKIMARRYTLADLVALAVKLAKPFVDPVRREFGTKAKAEVPVIEPVAIPAEVPVVAQAEPPVQTQEVVVPVTKTKAKPRKATRKPATALVMPSAARITTKTKPSSNANVSQLYRRAKRGDRYEPAINPEPGTPLYRRERAGKVWKYHPVT